MKVSELTGIALDWAVAKCEGVVLDREGYTDPETDKDVITGLYLVSGRNDSCAAWSPSTLWAQGGPIIEREDISLAGKDSLHNCWAATNWSFTLMTKFGNYKCDGETPLIAAMRCYVASKLGDEIEIPEELL